MTRMKSDCSFSKIERELIFSTIEDAKNLSIKKYYERLLPKSELTARLNAYHRIQQELDCFYVMTRDADERYLVEL